jgi:hypothetical protein
MIFILENKIYLYKTKKKQDAWICFITWVANDCIMKIKDILRPRNTER